MSAGLCRALMDTDDSAPHFDALLARHPQVRARVVAVHESGIPEYEFVGSHAELLGLLEDPEGWAGLSSEEMLECIEELPPEARIVWRSHVAVCSETGEPVAALGPREVAVQVHCPRGHWTWEDGNYCGACGVALR